LYVLLAAVAIRAFLLLRKWRRGPMPLLPDEPD